MRPVFFLTRAYMPHYLVFILLFFSGNPLAQNLFGKIGTFVGLFLCMIILGKQLFVRNLIPMLYFKVFVAIILIFIFQNLLLGYVSWLGGINFLAKVLLGGVVVRALTIRFGYYFFVVVSWLSLVSLIGFVLINLFELSLPYITVGSDGRYSYFIYGVSKSHFHQNQGMFWEPGAYSGILTLCLAVNFNHLKEYWAKYRAKLIYIIVALLTTQSTTGFIVGIMIFLFVLMSNVKPVIFVLVSPILIFLLIAVYESTEFLKSKIEYQYELSTNLSQNEFSNTRFGSLIFDWHYIKKSPLIGNGLHESTRYADHPYLLNMIRSGEDLGNGNGFSNYAASMGLIFVLGYFLLLFRGVSEKSKYFAFVVCCVVLLNLQGEQWFNFPLYLGLPFMLFNQRSSKAKKNNELNVPSNYQRYDLYSHPRI